MVDRADAVEALCVRTRLLEHPVAVSDEIRRVRVNPGDTVLLERLEPVVEDLGVRTQRVVGMGALHGMLVQKSDGGLNQLKLRGEQQWKPDGSRLAQRNRRSVRGRRA